MPSPSSSRTRSYFDPSIGRYLQPEPRLSRDPKYVQLMAKNGHDVPVYSYANNNPLFFTDPSGLDVELYCEWITGHDLGSLGRHCYLRSYTPWSGWGSYDVTVEIWGPPGPTTGDPDYPYTCVGRGRPKELTDNPQRDSNATKIYVKGGNTPGIEDCILNAFRRNAKTLPPYNFLGPNSNTFAQDLLTECGASADFPFNASMITSKAASRDLLKPGQLGR